MQQSDWTGSEQWHCYLKRYNIPLLWDFPWVQPAGSPCQIFMGHLRHVEPLWPVAQPAQNFVGAKYFEFKRATGFGLGHRVSKHKATRYARNLGGRSLWPPQATPMVVVVLIWRRNAICSYLQVSQLAEMPLWCYNISFHVFRIFFYLMFIREFWWWKRFSYCKH